jgi:hypothetical protein
MSAALRGIAEQPRARRAYEHAFRVVQQSGAKDITVSHSVKFSRAKFSGNDTLQSDRYFLRFQSSAPREICRRLAFPGSAEAFVQTSAGGWSSLGSVGSALSGDQVSYRSYFRSGEDVPGRVYGWAIEWNSRPQPLHIKRKYTRLGDGSVARARDWIERELSVKSKADHTLVDGWIQFLTRHAECQLLEVSDPSSGRLSLDASPAYAAPVTMGEYADLWESWHGVLGGDGRRYASWLKRVSSAETENIAIGRGSDGELFTTVYFGKFDRPQNFDDVAPVQPPSRTATSPVFAIGQIGVDLDQSRLDQLASHFVPEVQLAVLRGDQGALAAALQECPEAAPAFSWTLNIGGAPAFSIQPASENAETVYAMLVDFLREQPERVSIAGTATGSILNPALRGMFSWATAALMESLGDVPAALGDCLARLYAEHQNSGTEPRDRALNFAVTQPSMFVEAFRAASGFELSFRSIRVAPHLFQSHGLNWWDVHLIFAPRRPTPGARLETVVTVDVSDPLPVFVSNIQLFQMSS